MYIYVKLSHVHVYTYNVILYNIYNITCVLLNMTYYKIITVVIKVKQNGYFHSPHSRLSTHDIKRAIIIIIWFDE